MMVYLWKSLPKFAHFYSGGNPRSHVWVSQTASLVLVKWLTKMLCYPIDMSIISLLWLILSPPITPNYHNWINQSSNHNWINKSSVNGHNQPSVHNTQSTFVLVKSHSILMRFPLYHHVCWWYQQFWQMNRPFVGLNPKRSWLKPHLWWFKYV